MPRIGVFVLVLAIVFTSCAQKKYWHFKDPAKGRQYGTAIKSAYKRLEGKKREKVIVAVIDIGTDIQHPALQPYIWTNTGEIAGNGIDDDGNGYADDIHGWNFLGGEHDNLMYEATEETRAWQAIEKRFREVDTLNLSPEEANDYAKYKTLRAQYQKEQAELEGDAKSMAVAAKLSDKWFWRQVLKLLAGKEAVRQIKDGAAITAGMARYNKMDADSLRRAVIGDNPDDLQEHYYGNNDVTGPDASHGTHVAGIITAMHNGELMGVKGMDKYVQIMPIRTIPWADERDKDVANAIRYAADNGAKVINMSFGKSLSPYKRVVDEAISYAAAKDVLLIHAAGNEAVNISQQPEYPNPVFEDGSQAVNWIEVGASQRKKGKKLVASFSNYGANTVTVFAPGVSIYATLPGGKYGMEQGTSMAAPVVSGIAAMIRSYFPELTAEEVKKILTENVSTYSGEVRIPGRKGAYTTLKQLSISGGVVNADRAVQALLR